MSQCGDYEDIIFYVINEFYGIVIAVYFLPFKKPPCIMYMPGVPKMYHICFAHIAFYGFLRKQENRTSKES